MPIQTINGVERDIAPFSNLTGAYLTGAYLRGADLRGADLTGADLTGAYLRGAYLRGADLRGADLRGADLRGADLRGAYLTGAYLTGAYLTGAYLTGADLTGAYLTGGPNGDPAELANTVTAVGWVAQVKRSDGYEAVMFATDRGHLIKGGCRLFTLGEFRAHVARGRAGTLLGDETLDILNFLEARWRAYLRGHEGQPSGASDGVEPYGAVVPEG